MPRGFLAGVLRGIAVMAGVVTLTFLLLHAAPGDPVSRLLGPAATTDQLTAMRHEMGLDRPLLAQYATWLGRLARGDLGRSAVTGTPVGQLLARAWPATALLVVVSLTLTYLSGILIGSWQANTTHRQLDRAATLVTVGLTAAPGYWLALVLVMVFTYTLRWLPAFGATGLDAEFLTREGRIVDLARHAVLPLATLTLIGVGGTARFVRVTMRELAGAPFLVVATAKGLRAGAVTRRHQLRNALVPVVTLLGLSLPALFSGTIFVEAVFAWPGVGQLMVQGVQARDYPVVMAAATVSALLVVVGNLCAEALVLLVDPRTRVAAHD